jgi:hypothetical protein
MSHQVFLSPSNGRSNRSFSGSSLPLCSTYPGDQRAQQALYMGCPPGNTNMVSFSPGGEHDRFCIPSSGSLFTPISMHLPPQQSAYPPSQPRFMYPTSYCPGNPGFYYDLMQNSSHTASQTTMPYPPSTDCATSTSVPATPTYIPTSMHTPYIPSNPSVYFSDVYPRHPSAADVYSSPSVPDGLSPNTPGFSSFEHRELLPDPPLDPETQSLGGRSESTHSIPPLLTGQTTPPCTNVHPMNFPVDCQTKFDPPSLQVKEQKKLALPNFNPSKMSWQNVSMKLHAALIEKNMDYLLAEQSTNAFNYSHSKELMVELYKKLQGGALDLFSSLKAQHYYLGGRHGIEMIKALVDKFHPMDSGAIQALMSSMQSLQLLDTEDLSVYRDKLENLNLQLS